MTTNQNATRAIVIKTDRNGKRRAQYLCHLAGRMMPMPIAEADLMIATGTGELCDRHPFTGEWL